MADRMALVGAPTSSKHWEMLRLIDFTYLHYQQILAPKGRGEGEYLVSYSWIIPTTEW
jgi:hypothetical protein